MSEYVQSVNLDQLIKDIRKVTGTPAKSIEVPDGNTPFCKVYEYYDANAECHHSTIVRLSPKGVDIVNYMTPFNERIYNVATPHMQRIYLTHKDVEEIFITNLTKTFLEEKA